MVNSASAKVLAICVDAMSLDYIRPHLGRLPAFKALLDGGAYKALTTSADPLTASIWASFATGEAPGAHGHYYPFQWDPEAMGFDRTSASGWKERLGFEPFWHGLAQRGVATVALDPGTPYAAPADAPLTEIVNWSYQSSGAATTTRPRALAEIRRRFGRRPIGKEVPVPKTLAHSRRIRDDLINAIDAKAGAALWLMENEDWRLFLVGFYEVHRAGHNLLVVDGDYGSEADPDALLAIYEAQDRALRRLIEKAGRGVTIILFSLHGMVPNWSQEHFTDRIMAALTEAWNVAKGAAPRALKRDNLMTRLRAAVPARVQFSLAYLLGEKVQDWVVDRGIVGGLDWLKTPAFRLASGGEGYIRLNIRGRERLGCLAPDEVADYVAWLKARLQEIRIAGTDAPLIRDVIEVKSLYPGERTGYLPDLVLAYAPEEPVTAIESPAIGRLEAHLGTGRGGNHAPDAFMVVAGPGKKSSAVAAVHDIRDMRALIETLLLGDTPAASSCAAAELAGA